MLIPARMIKLDKPHIALGQTPRQQAVRREGSRVLRLRPVEFKNTLRLARQVHHIGHAGLHAKGHFVLGHPGVDLRIAQVPELQMLHLGPTVEQPAPALPGDPVGILEVQHRILPRSEQHALMLARQKPIAPKARVQRLVDAVLGNQNHEGRKILIGRTQPVAEPGTETRPTCDLGPGLKEGDGRIMIDGLGVQRTDDAQVVGDLGSPGQQLADPSPRLAVTGEFEDRPRHRQRRLLGRHPGQALPHAHTGRKILAGPLHQLGLVVEGLQLRRTAAHEEVDHPLGLGRHVTGRQDARKRSSRSGSGFTSHQATKGRSSQAQTKATEEIAAVHAEINLRAVHGDWSSERWELCFRAFIGASRLHHG